MHFNVYVDDVTGHQLKDLAEQRGQTCNALLSSITLGSAERPESCKNSRLIPSLTPSAHESFHTKRMRTIRVDVLYCRLIDAT